MAAPTTIAFTVPVSGSSKARDRRERAMSRVTLSPATLPDGGYQWNDKNNRSLSP